MAIVRTKVLPLGRHVSPEGEVQVTRERVKKWVAQDAQMRQEKIEIPIPWGHTESALPHHAGSNEEAAYRASKFNAGYVRQLMQGADGGLEAELDAPGVEVKDGKLVATATLPDGTPVQTAINRVSAMIGPWRDGKGRDWDDIVGHVALVVRPVAADQNGFQQLSTGASKTASKFVCLSTATRRLATMPDDKEKDKEPGKGGGDTPAEVSDDLMKPPPEDETLIGESLEGAAQPNSADQEIEQIKTALNELGVPLPQDTNAATFNRDLLVAITVLVGKMKTDAANEPPPEPTEQPREVQQPAMMMSTVRGNPVLLKLATEDAETRRTARLAKIGDLEKRNLPPTVGAKLKNIAGQKLLSLNPSTGARLTLRIDEDLALLDNVLPAIDSPMNLLATARPGDSPVAQPGGEATWRPDVKLHLTDSEYAEVKRRAKQATGR